MNNCLEIYSLVKIETPRLIIRPVKHGDEVEINQCINRSLLELQRWMPWANDPSLEATRAFVENGVKSWQSKSNDDFPMVVINKASNRIIAVSGFNDDSRARDGIFVIGYWIDEPFRGKGLVTELANALTRYALVALKANKVIITCQVENEKSVAVPKRLGFVCDGIQENDRIDCVSNEPANGYLFSCANVNLLPALQVNWE